VTAESTAVNDIDLNLLPIAFAVYDELSVSRAARVLGMSQPAVSMALRRLRQALNDPLFIRAPTGITPTPRAHALVRLARPIVEQLHKNLLTGEQFDAATSTRPFRIAVSDIGEMVLLPCVMQSLRGRAPHCPVESVSVATDQLAQGLEEGRIDLAIGYFPPLALKSIRQRRVSVERFACLMRTDHPLRSERLSLADFIAAEHIVVDRPGRSQEVLERFLERHRIHRNIALLTPHFLGVPFLVAQSDLIATVPHSVATYLASTMPTLAVVPTQFEITPFDLKLHWHRGFDGDPRSAWLREQVASAFAHKRVDSRADPAA
jgi:DNA-binding transcriptional LysR family regulator